MTAAAILFTTPYAIAAEDDDVIVFGNEVETDDTNSTESANESGYENKEDIPSEAAPIYNEQVTEVNEPSETNSNSDSKNEQSSNIPDENGSNNTIDKIDNSPAVNNLNSEDSEENYTIGEIIHFDEDTNVNKNNDDNNSRSDFNKSDIVDNYNKADEEDKNYNDYELEPKVSNNDYDVNNNVNDVNDLKNKSYIKTNNNKSTSANQSENQKKLKARFVKLLSDDSYDYYLDRNSVRWVYVPYSKTEYMADVWIRMLDRAQNNSDMPSDLYNYINDTSDEISEAAAKGIIYDEVDVKVLRTKKYFLEHYYIRPKKQQIQFLCELEVIGRPQNAISERAYDYKNWESLIPGSVEFSIYHGVISDIGTSKANSRGHMTFIDMLDEYARIALN